MNNFTLLNQVVIIFLMMMVGVYARKKNIVDEKINKALTSLLLNITLPLNIIASFNFDYSSEMLKDMLTVFIFGVVLHPLVFLISKLFFAKFPKDEKNILVFSAVFSNCAFMAFPVLESLYGKVGILYGSGFLAPFNVYVWTLGVILYQDKGYKFNVKNVFNPGVTSVILGIIVFLTPIKLPFALQRCFEMVGSMTTPLSMIITGVIIGGIHFKEIFSKPSIYVAAFIRLILVPVVAALALKAFGITGTVYGVSVLVAAMPVAAMATVLAESFNGNSKFASQSVFITTIASLITIPIIALIFI